MSKFSSSPKTPEPTPPPPLPKGGTPEQIKARKDEEEKKRRSRRSSVLTGAKGVTEELGSVSRPEGRQAQLAKKLGE